MFRYVSLILMFMLAAAVRLSAQSAVEKVIVKYEDTDGARYFIAQGPKMILARRLLKSTQVAPVAQDVDELYILKMQSTSRSAQEKFTRDLSVALESYEYYGKQPSTNGEVDVYIHRMAPGSSNIDELVIYNPAIYSLNSFVGQFTASQLMKLENPSDK
jgi:hypothetical protein